MIKKIKPSLSEKILFIFLICLGILTFSFFFIAKNKCLFVKKINPEKIQFNNPENIAVMNVECGNVIIELYPNVSPVAVSRFKYFIKKGSYNKSAFYKVIKNTLVQAGDLEFGNIDNINYFKIGSGQSGYGTLKSELNDNFIFENLSTGIYEVTLSEAISGCISEELIIELIEPSEINIINTTFDASCFNENDGSLELEITGGTPPYNTFIGNETLANIESQTGNNIVFNNLAAGSYYFTTIDNNGCLVPGDEVFFTIQEPTDLTITTEEIGAVTCENASNGFINIVVSGGVGTYTYIWTACWWEKSWVCTAATNASSLICWFHNAPPIWCLKPQCSQCSPTGGPLPGRYLTLVPFLGLGFRV